MDLLQDFIRHLQGLIGPDFRDSRYLLAVSGGIDSVVMAHLFQRADLPAGLAHINFQLRGAEADADAEFVRALARELGFACYTTSLDTPTEASVTNQSIQGAARAFRYRWLEATRQAKGYDFVATGHQLDDAVETFLYNFAKGTGLRGLRGIPARRDRIIRPLMFTQRSEIDSYQQTLSLPFREDASNAEDAYQRNRIRHHLVPQLKAINPNLETTSKRTFRALQDAYLLFQERSAILRDQYTAWQGQTWRIDRSVSQHPAFSTLLYEWLMPYGFLPDQLEQLGQTLDTTEPGALWYSATHQLLVDRTHLLVESLAEPLASAYLLTQDVRQLTLAEGILSLQVRDTGRPANLHQEPWVALLDTNQLVWPLQLRRWRAGDVFRPLGMRGMKKVQDFFTDEKINRFDKKRAWLLVDARDRICWVVGHRIDDRFKITPATDGYVELVFKLKG